MLDIYQRKKCTIPRKQAAIRLGLKKKDFDIKLRQAIAFAANIMNDNKNRLNPQFIFTNGVKQFAVIPIEEFETMQ